MLLLLLSGLLHSSNISLSQCADVPDSDECRAVLEDLENIDTDTDRHGIICELFKWVFQDPISLIAFDVWQLSKPKRSRWRRSTESKSYRL